MKHLEIPCPQCSASVAVPSSAASATCPSCGHTFSVPARAASLPQRRAAGEKPRAQAEDAERPLAPAPRPATGANGPKTRLPTQRHADRPVAETLPASASAIASRPKVELPSRRAADEKPRLREPVPHEAEPEPVSEKTAPIPAPAPASVPVAAPLATDAPKATGFRLGENRKLQLTAQGEVDGDVEATSGWGSGLDEGELARRRNRRLIVIGTAVAIPLVAALLVIVFSHQFSPPEPVVDDPAAVVTGSDANPAEEARATAAVVR